MARKLVGSQYSLYLNYVQWAITQYLSIAEIIETARTQGNVVLPVMNAVVSVAPGYVAIGEIKYDKNAPLLQVDRAKISGKIRYIATVVPIPKEHMDEAKLRKAVTLFCLQYCQESMAKLGVVARITGKKKDESCKQWAMRTLESWK